VDADLEAGIAHRAHRGGVAPADVRRGQQRAVEQRPHAVNLHDTRPRNFLEETRPQHAGDRPAGLIRSERKKETRGRAHFLAIGHEIRHALASAAVGIDINFERKANGHVSTVGACLQAIQASHRCKQAPTFERRHSN